MKFTPTVLAWLLPAAQVLCWSHTTEAEFHEAIGSNEHTLAAFILPEQDASKAFETEWAQIQETEKGRALSLDCSARPEFCAELGIVSHPSVRLYRDGGNGAVYRYRGPRKSKSIIAFLRRALRPTLSYVNDKNVTSFLSVDDVVFIGHIAADDASLRQRFEDVAIKYRDRFSFALSSDVGSQSALGCYNSLDDVQKSAVDLTAVEALERFVKSCAKPLIPELTRRNELELMSAGKSMVHYFVHSDAERDEFVTEMRPLAKKYEEYLQFDTIDANEYAGMVEMMGLAPGSKKVLSVQNPRNGDVFPYKGGQQISAAVVEAFLVDIINGKVQTWTGQEREEDRKHEEL